MHLNQPVVDRTGLTGDNAALLSAIEEQLGLKLEPQTIPLPVLVVDRAEKPATN
jgi:uncharacterized protein (TIGR03435 family)